MKNRVLLAAGSGMALVLLARAVSRQARRIDARGKVVLVTGGSRGLGFLLAREFARRGSRVAICARDPEELKRARDELREQGGDVLALRCDISDEQQVRQLVEEVAQRLGGIEVLVNNAGILQVGPVQSMTLQDFREAMAVMYWGVLYPTLAVLPHMQARGGGRIVNITSIGGRVSVPHLLPYNSAKFAAVGLSEGLRAELAPYGIKVTTVAPGLMRTGSYLNALFKGRQPAEFTWFGVLGNLPVVSMDAERAAQQVVEAGLRGDSQLMITLPANAIARFHGLFPGLTADLMALVNRLVLPSERGGSEEAVRGMETGQVLPSPLFNALTIWGRTSARRFHQYPGPVEAHDGHRAEHGGQS